MKPAVTSGFPFYKQSNIFNDVKTCSLLDEIRKCVDHLMHHRNRDPRTAWSADRSVRVGARFFRFLWSW